MSSSTVKQGDTLTVTIQSLDENYSFRGFIIQARNRADDTKVIGKFRVADGIRTMDCEELPADSVATHTNSGPKSKVHVQWIAPKTFLGLVIFQ